MQSSPCTWGIFALHPQGVDVEQDERKSPGLMASLSWHDVTRYRAALLAAYRVRTKRAALAFVDHVGFCYAFTGGPGGLPGLFDVLATRSIDRKWEWAWQWKDDLATDKKALLWKGHPPQADLHFAPLRPLLLRAYRERGRTR